MTSRSEDLCPRDENIANGQNQLQKENLEVTQVVFQLTSIDGRFQIDGKDTFLRAGEYHYFRIDPELKPSQSNTNKNNIPQKPTSTISSRCNLHSGDSCSLNKEDKSK